MQLIQVTSVSSKLSYNSFYLSILSTYSCDSPILIQKSSSKNLESSSKIRKQLFKN